VLTITHIGDFASTATAIARNAGIITTPPSEVKHFSDLQYDLELSKIPKYDPNADNESRPMRSLVLSGSDIMAMTESQWKQAIAVGNFRRSFIFGLLIYFRISSSMR
jgi:sodium/potassium-transporting ATPase subunit alpha